MQRKTDVNSIQRTRSLMRKPNWLEMRQIEEMLNPKQPSPPEDVITPAMLEWHRTAPTGKVGLVVLPSRPQTQYVYFRVWLLCALNLGLIVRMIDLVVPSVLQGLARSEIGMGTVEVEVEVMQRISKMIRRMLKMGGT